MWGGEMRDISLRGVREGELGQIQGTEETTWRDGTENGTPYTRK